MKLLTTSEVAAFLGISLNRVKSLTRSDRQKTIKPYLRSRGRGNESLFLEKDVTALRDFLSSNEEYLNAKQKFMRRK